MASGQKRKTTTKKTAPQKSALPPIRREVGGGVCLLLALCVVVSYFQADAIVLNLLGNLLKGLAGYGYWLAAPALALAGVNLLAHRGRPVVLRTVCALVLPVLLGAILLHPNFIALKAAADVVHVLGLPVKMVTYSSSVIPIFLITLVVQYVERFVIKVVPSVVKFILRPVLTILIMAPISLCVLGPLGSIIGDGLVNVLLAIEKVCPWALPTVIGAFMPFLVMTGMHYSLLPAYVNSLSMLGYETVIGPGNLPSNIAQGAAALCVAIKTKNKNFRQLAVSGGVTALLGVTEPALFGVNVRLRKPLIATTIGGGLGGLYAGLTGVRRFGGGGAGLAAIGLYVGENPMNVINALISAAIAFVATFAILWFIGFDDVPEEA